jgi:hypothetical protein
MEEERAAFAATVEEARFGMYAPPSIAAGTVYNGDLDLSEVRS